MRAPERIMKLDDRYRDIAYVILSHVETVIIFFDISKSSHDKPKPQLIQDHGEEGLNSNETVSKHYNIS